MKNAVVRTLLLIGFWCWAGLAVAAPSWTGTWDTRWQDGGARMELKQDGAQVRGEYPTYDGVIEGRIEGPVLKGRWIRGAHSGPVEFVMEPDGTSFVGRYDSGEWWTGGRVEGSDASTLINQSSPREALRTFLIAGNLARFDAPDLYARAASVIDFGEADANLPAAQRVEKAKVLFALADQTTYRLFLVPDESIKDDTFAIRLPQAGTDAVLPVDFVRKNGKWFIVEPTDEVLAAARKALLARSGGQFPLPDDYKQRRSARDAMRSFYRAFFDWDQGGREQARETLDLSKLPEAVRDYSGDLTSLYLNGILNRVGILEPQEVPDDPTSTQPYILFSHPAGRIVIAPVGAGKDAVWKFNDDTVARARDLFIVAEDLPPLAGRKLPAPPSIFFDIRRGIRSLAPAMLTQIGSLEIWQIIGWAGVFLVASALGYVVTRILLGPLGRVFGRANPEQFRRRLRWPLWGTLAFSLYKLMIPAIGLPDYAKRFSVGSTGTALALSIMWLGWVVLDAIESRFFGREEGKLVTVDNILVSLTFGFLKLVLIVLGFTAIAIELSLPYEGIIASLSIGGLAVAFASRETLSNIFGAGVLAIDRPFRRGDTISAGGTSGTVEHVGIRSTRVRTSDDSLIIMPNGKLADAMVNNLGSRRYHQFQATLPLPYSTSAEQIESLLAGVRDLVAGLPQAAPDRTSVSVSGLKATGIELAVKYGLDSSKGGNETDITNTLTLDILRLCERLGVHATAVA